MHANIEERLTGSFSPFSVCAHVFLQCISMNLEEARQVPHADSFSIRQQIVFKE